MSGDGKRILVTGASGFIGGHLVPKLVSLGYDVYVLERYMTGRYVLGATRDVTTVFGDLRDFQAARQAIRDVQPEILVHLAALSPVAYSYDHPQEVIETNFIGTVNLAEACMRNVAHFKHFLFAGTAEEYGNNDTRIKTEESRLTPNSPYSVSKVSADSYLRYMWNAYRFPITILRPFNTYGRKDNAHFVVERTVHQALTSSTIRLGDSKPKREFLYVDDHVKAYLTCLEKLEKAMGQVFNFCTGRGVTIKAMVDEVVSITGFKGQVVWDTIPKRPLDIFNLIGSPTKAAKLLGWKADYSLEDGLRKTVQYWKKKLGQ